MTRRLRLLLLAGGLALFAYLLSRIGLAALAAEAAKTGWVFIPILLLYGVVYVCNTGAWMLIMAGEPRRPSFWRLYMVITSGFALNWVTPVVAVGGEPFKIAAVAPWLTTRRAAGSVVIHNGLRWLSFLLSWLTAVLLGFWMLPHDPLTVGLLLLTTLVTVTLTAVLLAAHRRGALARMLNALYRVPLCGRLARALEPRREFLEQMDQQIAQFYHEHPGHFARALILEYLSRAVYMGEYYLIALSIGLPMGYLQAYLVGGLASLIQNLLFFMPFEVGSKEGAHYLLFGMLGFDPQLGVYTAIVTRLRDLVWIGLGLLLVWSAGRNTATHPPHEAVP
jgi:uncharacterized protein (TIRG00374 family)